MEVSVLSDLKIYFKIAIINIAWYDHKGRYTNEWYKIEIPEISLHKCDQCVFDKGAKIIQLDEQ